MRPSRAELERELARAESQAARLRCRLEVSGYDNGYYGVGYWIEVTR